MIIYELQKNALAYKTLNINTVCIPAVKLNTAKLPRQKNSPQLKNIKNIIRCKKA